MQRISTLGASQLYLARLMEIRQRTFNENLQVTTHLKSQTYDGIANVARRTINMENEKSLSTSYISSNAVVEVQQTTASTALKSAQTTINTLKNRLLSFASGAMKDATQIRDVQEVAMRALTELQSSLNTSVDGSFLFSGGRKDVAPVDFKATSLADFQAIYDGALARFPTLRDANLLDTALTNRETGSVNFDVSNGLIFSNEAGAFRKVATTSYVQVAGTVGNDGNLSVTGHAVTNSGGVPMVPASSIGSSAFITYQNGASTLTNATTGALSIKYDAAGNLVATPTGPNSMSGLYPGAKFTIANSDAKFGAITATDTTVLNGTNLATYTAGSTTATPLNFEAADQLTLTDGINTAAFSVGTTNTVQDLVNWVNGLNATFGSNFAKAAVDNEGRLQIVNTEGAGSTIAVSGTLRSLLGLPSAITGAGVAGTAGTPAKTIPILDNALPQKLTSLTGAGGAQLINIGDKLDFTVGGVTNSYTVTASSTLTDLAQFIQQQDTTTLTAAGAVNNVGAQVTFSGGKLSIKNNSAGAYTLAGNVATALGLPASINAAATGQSSSLPSVKGSYDGNYTVVGYDSTTSSVTFATDTDQSLSEPIAVTGFSLKRDSNADGIPDATVSTGLTSGNAVFSVSGNTVTLTLPSGGTALTGSYAVGDSITIAGTEGHNGTFRVKSVGANSVSWTISPDVLRTAPFLPQTNRSDFTMTFPTNQPSTINNPNSTVPGTVSGGIATMDKRVFSALSFAADGTITSDNPGSLKDTTGQPYPPVGTVITLKSQTGINDGVYEVTANDSTKITVKSHQLTSELGVNTATFSATSWYKGDTMALNAHVDRTTTINTSLSASDAAFEKAIRAMGIIAQGAYGTAGGLDKHPERVQQALALLNDALQHSPDTVMPFGKELTSDVDGLTKRVELNVAAIKRTTDNLKAMNSVMETRIADLTQVDMTDAIVRLQNDNQALEASYRALSQGQNMSLLNYLK